MNVEALKGKKVVIAPFSTEAILLYHQLLAEEIEVIAFMDADYALHNCNYKTTMIIPYLHFTGQGIVAITAKPGYISQDEIYNSLINVGYQSDEIIRQEDIAFECTMKNILHDIAWDELEKFRNVYWLRLLKSKAAAYIGKEGLVVDRFHLVVTTRCSLKCQGCLYLEDYYLPGTQRDMNLESTIHSFDVLMEHIDYVGEVCLIGGEPFLYEKIGKLLQHIVMKKYIYKIGMVTIITNGTVLPTKPILEIMGKYSYLILIMLSDYGCLSFKRLELVALLNQYGCSYCNVMHDAWYLTNQPMKPSFDVTREQIAAKCRECDCMKGGRLRIMENKVYNCHFVAFAAECHAIPRDKQDYLDMYIDTVSKEKLQKFMYEVHPGMAYCDSPCNTENQNNIIPVGKQATSIHECIRYD